MKLDDLYTLAGFDNNPVSETYLRLVGRVHEYDEQIEELLTELSIESKLNSSVSIDLIHNRMNKVNILKNLVDTLETKLESIYEDYTLFLEQSKLEK